jgi:hypothetical protein
LPDGFPSAASRHRLDETFKAARTGLERAEGDDERWTNSIGFLSQMNKAVESGLKMTGRIEGGRGELNLRIEQLIVLPAISTATQRPLSDLPTVDLTPMPTKKRTNGTQWAAADHSRGLSRAQNVRSEEQDAEIGALVDGEEDSD